MRNSTLPRGPIRVAIYLRVSTVKQLKGYGLKVQLDSVHAWLAYKVGKGRYTAEIYTDGAVSGKLASRPDLDAMNADIAAGKFDLVIFGKLDRIGRTMKDIHRWVYDTTDIEAVPGRKVRVATADGRIDSEDGMFGLQLSLLAYMAEIEHALILERTASGRESKLAEGGWAFGSPPFGITLEGKGRDARPVLDPDEAKVYEKAAELILDLDKPLPEAREELNTLGLLTRYGRPWTDANLRHRLMGDALLGYMKVRDPEGRSGAKRDEDGNFVHGDSHTIPLPQILPPERVKALRAALERGRWTKDGENDYLLSGRLIGLCGRHYIGADKSTTGRRIVYRCTGAIKNHKNYIKCGCKEIWASELEQSIWGGIVRGLQDADHVKGVAQEWLGAVPQRAASYRARIGTLEGEIARKRKARKSKVLAMLAVMEPDEDGEIDTAMVDELKTELRRKEAALRKELDTTREWLAEAEEQEQRVSDILALAEQMSPRLEDLAPRQKRDVMDLFQIKVTVTAPAGRFAVKPSQFEAWFERNGKLVPGPLTDAQWELAEPIVPAPESGRARSRWISRRVILDGIFHKVREGLSWQEVDPGRYCAPENLKIIGGKMLADGTFARVVDALGDYAGHELPSLIPLPDLDIAMSFDSQHKMGDDTTQEGVLERASWILFGQVLHRIDYLTSA